MVEQWKQFVLDILITSLDWESTVNTYFVFAVKLKVKDKGVKKSENPDDGC